MFTSIQFKVKHAVPQAAADLCANTYSADLRFRFHLLIGCMILGLCDWGIMGVWVCEFVGLCTWAYVFVCLCVCVFVGLWVCGFVDLWVCGFVGSWVRGFVGSCGFVSTKSQPLVCCECHALF